ncbi:MAG: hypothetical protein ACOYJG_11930 [Prevotella sp.]|jgi:hypothetical protein
MAKLAIISENLRRLAEYLSRNNYFFSRQGSRKRMPPIRKSYGFNAAEEDREHTWRRIQISVPKSSTR